MNINKNPFDVLGLSENASQGDVKKAYFNLVKQFSPEKHGEQFKEIREAYDLLKDPAKRLELEVFQFTRPPQKISKKATMPCAEIKKELFLQWLKETQIDLYKTDFTGDFEDV